MDLDNVILRHEISALDLSTPFERVPSELLLELFFLLPTTEDVHHLARVSKYLNTVFNTHRLRIYRNIVTKSPCYKFDIALTQVLRLKHDWISRRLPRPFTPEDFDILLIKRCLSGAVRSLTDDEVFGIVARRDAMRVFEYICFIPGIDELSGFVSTESEEVQDLIDHDPNALSFISRPREKEKCSRLSVARKTVFYQAIIHLWLKIEVQILLKLFLRYINDSVIAKTAAKMLDEENNTELMHDFLYLELAIFDLIYGCIFYHTVREIPDEKFPPDYLLRPHEELGDHGRAMAYKTHQRFLTPPDVLELVLCPKQSKLVHGTEFRYNKQYMASRWAYELGSHTYLDLNWHITVKDWLCWLLELRMEHLVVNTIKEGFNLHYEDFEAPSLTVTKRLRKTLIQWLSEEDEPEEWPFWMRRTSVGNENGKFRPLIPLPEVPVISRSRTQRR